LLPQIPAVFAFRQNVFVTTQRPSVAKLWTSCAILVALATANAQQPATQANPRPAPRPPDVYLASLKLDAGKVVVGAPLNITDRVGYDNQPSFTTDGSSVFFTSVREDAQADIYRYDIAVKGTSRVTTSAPESEYSATSFDGGRAISVIRVEKDSTQRLWKIPLDGSAPSVILERVKPVGYHAWADDHTLVLFVLGSPNTLQLADTRTGTADTITTNVGRSLHRIPRTGRVSFVHKVSATEWWIESLDPASRQTARLIKMPEGVEDYAWISDGSVLCGNGSTLMRWSGKSGDGWTQIADLSSAGVQGITRLAVSLGADRIAFVAQGK
jgi:hypothetical protein